jgi:hypothetical protein
MAKLKRKRKHPAGRAGAAVDRVLMGRHSPAGKQHLKRKLVDITTQVVLGKKAYRHSEARKAHTQTVTSSRRKLRRLKRKLGVK